VRKKTPKIAPFPWDFVTPPEEDRATAIGNMQKNSVKITHAVQGISSRTDRQTHIENYTDTHTLTSSSQYSADAPAVIIVHSRCFPRNSQGKNSTGIPIN